MGTTFDVWAAEDYAAQLEATEDGRSLLKDFRDALNHPHLQDYISAIGQPADGWTPGQVASMGRIHLLFAEDRIGVMRIPVGSPPSSGNRAADRAALEKLGELFTVLVYDQTTDEDGDGLFAWDQRLAEKLPGGWTNSAPFAIGSTDASRTLLHLTDRGSVLRWPEGSSELWLFGFTSFTRWFEWREESFQFALSEDGPVPG